MATQTVNDTAPATGLEGSSPPPGFDFLDQSLAAYFTANPPTEWFSAGYLEAEYTFYAIQTTFQTDLGLQAAPSTASLPGGDVDQNNIIRVRRPITYKVVNWIAQRYYVKPQLPHWDTSTSNEKLLSRTISARNPLQSINHKTWEVSGQYVYAFKKEPFIMVNNVEYFVLPAAKTAAENNKIPVALHAYTQRDFSFVPLESSWIPIDAPIAVGGDELPAGYNGRVGQLETAIRNDGPRLGGA